MALARIFLSPNWGIATELVRNYLQYLALAPVFFLNGHKPPPQKKDLVLHNGKSELDHPIDTEVILVVYKKDGTSSKWFSGKTVEPLVGSIYRMIPKILSRS